MLDLNLPASRGAAEPGVRFARHELGFQADPETREWAPVTRTWIRWHPHRLDVPALEPYVRASHGCPSPMARDPNPVTADARVTPSAPGVPRLEEQPACRSGAGPQAMA